MTVRIALRVPTWRLRRWLPKALAGWLVLALAQGATAQAPGPMTPMPAPATPAPLDAKPAKPAEPPGTISFVFDEKPWKSVLDWFAKESGLVFHMTGSNMPQGSLTLKPEAGRKYTIPQIVDLLNDSLVQYNFIIIRRPHTFTVLPADQKIPHELLARIKAEDLPNHGDTEMVVVTHELKALRAEDIVPQLIKLKGSFGEINSLGDNILIIQDKTRNVREIVKYLKELEEKSGDLLTHQCKFIRCTAAAETLKKLLTDASTTVTSETANAQQWNNQWGGGGWNQGGGGGWDGRGGGGRDGRGGGGNPGGGAIAGRFKSVQIASYEVTNTLMITGPNDKIAAAKNILKEIDVGQPGEKPRVTGEQPQFKNFAVPAGTAESYAKVFGDMYKTSLIVRIIPGANKNEITVYAPPADLIDIAKILNSNTETKTTNVIEIIPITNFRDPKEVVAGLQKQFPDSGNGPFIEPRTDPAPGIIVRGTQAQIDEVRSVYKKIFDDSGTLPPSMRVIPIANTSPSLAAEVIAEMLRKSSYPVEVRGGNPPPALKPVESSPAPGTTPTAPPRSSSTTYRYTKDGLQPISAQIVDPGAQPRQPDPTKKPVTITVAGDRIIITSDDPAALEMATQLARIFLQQADKIIDNLFEIIPLKHVNAEEAAKVISEIFNGPTQAPQGQQGGRGGGGGGFGGLGGGIGMLANLAGLGGSGVSTTPSKDRVRVVAEKQSNSLIVIKASVGDLAMMKALLRDAINKAQDTNADTFPKTHIIRLQNARADEVRNTLGEVYANQMGGRRGGGGAQAIMINPFIPQQPQQAQTAALTISIDDRSNSLFVNCNDTLFNEISKVVATLDKAAESTNEVVNVIPLNGIDPAILDAMVAALNGQQPNTQQRPGGFGGGQGGFGGGTGGGNPFGGGGGFGNFGGGGGNRGGIGGGFGGGGNRGGIGGGFGGGGNRGGFGGGGGNRGGGGGARPGGGRPRAETPYNDGGGGGPRNFNYRDMDVPSGASLIYDPESNEPGVLPSGIWQIQFVQTPAETAQPPMQPGTPPPGSSQPRSTQPGAQPGQPPVAGPPTAQQPPLPPGTLPAPMNPVQGSTIQGTPLYLLRTANPADMAALMRAIEIITQEAKKSQVVIELIPMKFQDATSVVNNLNTLFSRVNIGAGSTTLAAQGASRFGGGQFGGLGALFGGGFGGQNQQAQTIGSIFMMPLPRFNAILLAVPQNRLEDVKKQIDMFDQPNGNANGNVMSPRAYPLINQSAQNVSSQIQTFFNSRYGVENQATNQIRVFFDANLNTVYVQASPADLNDVAELIRILDSGENKSVNELRIFRLNNAFASDIAGVLYSALASNAVNPANSANATGSAAGGAGGGPASPFATGGGNFGALLGGQQPGGGGFNQGGFGGAGALGQASGFGVQGTFATANIASKSTAVKFWTRDGQVVETGFLVDIHIIPDYRINSIVVSAPAQTMRLIEKLLAELDVPSAASAEVKVFTLKKADALNTAQLLQQLFSRATTGGGNLGGNLLGGANTQNALRPLLSLAGDISDGANLIDIRLAVDSRTNSIIVAGSPSDMDTIRAIVTRLEDAEASKVLTKVYKLRNNAAADVVTAVLTFMQQKLGAEIALYNGTGTAGGTPFSTIQQFIFIQPEPITNTLLIAVAPKYYDEVISLIDKLDAPPPQVFVQVLIAEVQLRNNEEFGMEFGIQSPVLFARSQTSATASGNPGFNFLTTAIPPMPTVADPGVVGFQGLNSLGVGRSGASGVGGFVFSAASDTFSLLVRALKSQSRLDVLSKPQLLLTDNQTGFFQVGQRFPINNGVTTSPNVGVTTDITYEDIGITLRVTPRINPDGRVLMRVEPAITNPSPALINLGNGSFATAFDTESLQTTVLASDGETVVLGGLIRRSDQKTENKIPLLGDVPYLGAAFRFRTQQKERREVIFIVTPHIVRSEADMARVGAVEACKMGWIYSDVMSVNTYGGDLLSGRNPLEGMRSDNPLNWPNGSILPGGLLPDYTVTPGIPSPPQPQQQLPGGVQPDAPPSQPGGLPPNGSPSARRPQMPPTLQPIQPVSGQQPIRTPTEFGSTPGPAVKPIIMPKEGPKWHVFPSVFGR